MPGLEVDCAYCRATFSSSSSLTGHYKSCKELKLIREEILNEEFLRNNIEVLNKSANSLATEMNESGDYPIKINAQKIINACKKFGIKTLSVKESANKKETREKYRETCLERYGAENSLSKDTTPYKKRNRVVKEKYGVKNVFQLDEVKEKSRETMMERYGVSNPIHLETYRANVGRRSYIHKTIEKLLNERGFEFVSEINDNRFLAYNSFLDREYSPRSDMLIEGLKLVIEVNGDYWHANPKKYKPSDIIKRWNGEAEAGKVWEFDRCRKEQIESFGYKVITLWGSDIKKGDFEELWKWLK